jgi:hypothetical protein
MTTYITAGWRFDVGRGFDRVMVDTPIGPAHGEHAKPGCTIGYIAGNSASNLGFMRTPRVRVHVRRSALGED